MTSVQFNGCHYTMPGGGEQLWHADNEHLYTSEPDLQLTGESVEESSFFTNGNNNTILPCHILNLFIPLVDVGPDNGGTEFLLGSHFQNKFSSLDVIWQDSEKKEKMGITQENVQLKVHTYDNLIPNRIW